MPKSAFNAIKNSLMAFLGGAEVALIELEKGEEKPTKGENKSLIVKVIQIDGIHICFVPIVRNSLSLRWKATLSAS